MDDFEFDEVVLKDAVVIDTLVTYFSEGILGKTNLKIDLFQHFDAGIERLRVRVASRSEGGTNRELIAYRIFEVNFLTLLLSNIFKNKVLNHLIYMWYT